MNDVLHALAISGGLLSLVVILIIIVSIVTVKRGEASVAGAGHDVTGHSVLVGEASASGAAAAPAKAAAAKAGAAATEEINVGQILVYGVGLFVLTILALLGLSLLEHMQ